MLMLCPRPIKPEPPGAGGAQASIFKKKKKFQLSYCTTRIENSWVICRNPESEEATDEFPIFYYVLQLSGFQVPFKIKGDEQLLCVFPASPGLPSPLWTSTVFFIRRAKAARCGTQGKRMGDDVQKPRFYNCLGHQSSLVTWAGHTPLSTRLALILLFWETGQLS